MPTSETPENESKHQPETAGPQTDAVGENARHEAPEPLPPASLRSRWVNYDTHELLERISDLEDERRWARFREGVLWAILAHVALVLALVLLPKYVLHAPAVVDQNALKDKDFTYLDSPTIPSKPAPKLKPLAPPQIDKNTLDAMRKQSQEQARESVPQQQAPPQAQQPQAPPQATTQPKLAQPQQQAPPSQAAAPHPSAVPAKPSFAMGSQNPQDQLREAMKGAAHNRGGGGGETSMGGGSGAMRQHPGAGAGGVQILSDTQGVDFSAWLHAWYFETEKTWDPLIPDEVNPPILKAGQVMIHFKVLPNGRLMPGSVVLEGRSGDVALDRAAWGALTGSNYPTLPHNFHGPYLELRALFMYNERR